MDATHAEEKKNESKLCENSMLNLMI